MCTTRDVNGIDTIEAWGLAVRCRSLGSLDKD
jgi:hypothetical protein